MINPSKLSYHTKSRLFIGAIGIIVLIFFSTQYCFFITASKKNGAITQTVIDDYYLHDIDKNLSAADNYYNAYLSSPNSTLLQLFNNSTSTLTDTLLPGLYRAMPQYSTNITMLSMAVQKKLDLQKVSIHDSLNTSGNVQNEISSTNVTAAFTTLQQQIQHNRTKYIEEKNTVYILSFICIFIAFTLIGIILWRIYKLMKTKGWECDGCDKKILISRIEAENKSKSKIDFLSMVLDEVRIPMNRIISTSALLLRNSITDEQRQYANTIRRSSVALLTVVNDILDLSKIESGTLTLETTPFVLKDYIHEVYSLMAIDKNQMVLVYDDALPQVVESDPTKLRQILISLIANAMNFGEQWNALLNVHLIREEKGEVEIGFTLSASAREGEGLSKTASQDLIGGIAVGLSISARLASIMRGTLKTETRENSSDTVVFFSIKAKKVSIDSGAKTIPYTVENGKVDHLLSQKMPMRIIVANSDITTQILLSSALLKMGYTCLVARNGAECIQLAMDNKVDLLFIDRHLSDMEGPRVAEKIRGFYMNNEKPVIVGTTANPFFDKAAGDAAGVNDYIVKPFKPKDIEQMIEKWGNRLK